MKVLKLTAREQEHLYMHQSFFADNENGSMHAVVLAEMNGQHSAAG